MKKVLESWSALASHYIGEVFEHCKPFLDNDFDGMHPMVRFVSAQLYISCHLSSQSALLLAKELQEWDCELIMRSVCEGVVKYAYLFDGSDNDVINKVHQYWEVLPNFAAVKRSEKAKVLMNIVENYEHEEWKPISDQILNAEEIDRLRGGTNKVYRNQLDQKWSFAEIIRQFAESSDPLLRDFGALSYRYNTSSNLIHKDADGVGMIWERDCRDANRKEAVKLAHLARIISDICYYADMRAYFLFKYCNKKYSFLADMKDRYKMLFEELDNAKKNFNKIEYGV